jgi:hypothetical protein
MNKYTESVITGTMEHLLSCGSVSTYTINTQINFLQPEKALLFS